jgi:ribosomal subunit interface protein
VDVVVKARHAEVSPALRETTRKKIAHIERFASDVRLVEVDFSETATRRPADAHTCEILVHLRGQLVKGTAAAADQPVALDKAIEKVTHKMRQIHDRRSVERHGGKRRAKPSTGGAGDLDLGDATD